MSQPYTQQFATLDLYPLWSSLPELNGVADPFDYHQRMAVYKLLIESMGQRGVFGKENEMNVFWGYVFQLEWQWRSGRLRLPDTPEGRIDPNSMWGYSNHSLSIIPYIAAAQLGIAPEIEFLPPFRDSAVEYAVGGGKAGAYKIPAIFDEAIRDWRAFFEFANKFEPGKDIEPIRIIQWKAHKASLEAVEPGILELGSRHFALSEVDFLRGWTRMVDYLGIAAWRTDLVYMLENGVGTLPERLITADDLPGAIPDFDPRVNNNIRNISSLTSQSKRRFNFNLYLWKRAMRTRQARDEVLPMLDATFNPTPDNSVERRKLLRYVLKF